MLGLSFSVRPSTVPEVPEPGEAPDAYVERLARAKAVEVAGRYPEHLVIAGDTVVVSGGRIIEKPVDEEDAVRMLLDLAGRTHVVSSGLALATPRGGVHAGVERTRVTFRSFGPEEAWAYVATGEPMDKAGAYGIQGLGAALVRGVEGDFFGVMGLPISLLVRLMADAEHPFHFRGDEAVPLDFGRAGTAPGPSSA